MDTSTWRTRVLLEPRGFIRFLEFILAIVAFATTGGYSGKITFSFTCPNGTTNYADVFYPFRLSGPSRQFTDCQGNTRSYELMGDLSPSAQWFVFVGVTAFLYALASMIFYVIFDAQVRANHERLVTIGDLVGTVLYTFFWLTAASAWAWGLNEVKILTGRNRFFANEPFPTVCNESGSENICTGFAPADYGALNASVAFAFLNFFLWACNVWFVYKESPYHQEPAKNDNSPAEAVPPNNM